MGFCAAFVLPEIYCLIIAVQSRVPVGNSAGQAHLKYFRISIHCMYHTYIDVRFYIKIKETFPIYRFPLLTLFLPKNR